MTEEEFLELSKKCLSGQASAEELARLAQYKDRIQLENSDWQPEMGNQDHVYRELSDSLRKSTLPVKRLNFPFIRTAAIFLLVTAAGLLLYRSNQGIRSKPVAHVLPAANEAILTLADGTRISLDSEARDFKTADGIHLHKKKDGLLIYEINEHSSANLGQDQFNSIITPLGKHYSIVLSDGSKIWLNAGSELKFPAAFNGNERRVQISGEAYFEVAKDKQKPFVVQTSRAEVTVLGTHFNISSYPDDDFTATTLLEGSVRMSREGSAVTLKPGSEGLTSEISPQISVEPANLQKAVSWKEGLFVFENESLPAIMKQLSRWYDVEIEFKGNVRNKEFGGSISRFKEINEILEMMHLAGGINYKIEGRRVIIMD